MQWDDLRYVLAVRRAGTLTGASRELGVVRTTVGRRLRALEEQIGVRLFDETPEGLVPTAAGHELATSAESVEDEVFAVASRLAGRDAQLHGTLRVSVVDFVYECFADVFADFMTAYPGVALSVLSTDDEVSLRRREADVAIRMKDAPPEALIGRRLGHVEFGVYAHRTLVERVGKKAPLSAYPWLKYDARDDGRGLDPLYRRYAEGADTAMGFDAYNVMRHAVSSGLAVHFLARFDAERFEDLVRIGPVGEAPPNRALWLLTLPELRTNSRVRAFMDHMDAALRPRIAAAGPD